MKILVTGSAGFIGKNLVESLKNIRDGKDTTRPELMIEDIFEYDQETDPALFDTYCAKADFVFHLAGVNRPKDVKAFMDGNFGMTETLLELLRKYGNTCPVMVSSSIQAALDNPYGLSKKAGEDAVFAYGRASGAPVYVYRFPNVFGKWCRPNYNSAVATFCHNIAHDLPITVNDPSVWMTLVYIDDVVAELLDALMGKAHVMDDGFCRVPVEHKVHLGEIVDRIYEFKQSRETKMIPDLTEGSFSKKLYSTYLSYLPEDGFSYPLKMNVDARGSFTEIIRTPDRGQVSVNISKPGITKGNHWHHTKNEKFVVVHGHGLIQLRKLGVDANGEDYPVVNYEVSGDEMTAIDMIPGYTHNIINLSETEELVTVMWANESFDSNHPDTFFEEVE